LYNPAHLFLLECLASGERLVVQIVHGGLNGAAAGLHCALQVLVGNAASAEHVAVRKILHNYRKSKERAWSYVNTTGMLKLEKRYTPVECQPWVRQKRPEREHDDRSRQYHDVNK